MSTKDIVLYVYFGIGLIATIGFFIWHRKKGGLAVLVFFADLAAGEAFFFLLNLLFWPLVIAVAAIAYARRKYRGSKDVPAGRR